LVPCRSLQRLLCFLILRKKRSELDEELEFHLEKTIASRKAAGVGATEARRQALIEFGGIEAHMGPMRAAASRLVDRHGAAGRSLCAAWVSPQSTFCRKRPDHPSARHRRNHCCIQRSGPHLVSAFAVRGAEPGDLHVLLILITRIIVMVFLVESGSACAHAIGRICLNSLRFSSRLVWSLVGLERLKRRQLDMNTPTLRDEAERP